ncbi:MAG: zinc-binding dehydrogenase [Negativicutes bacterium]|nr:zinc-binding dehydrogenase [Negativicutes bacterium]
MIKAAVLEAPGLPLKVKELPKPSLEPGAVWLETIYSEVCGTDVHLFHGRLAGVPYPIIPGHINVGRIAETNGSVRDVDGNILNPGDVVTFMDVHETCHNCWFCLVAKTSTRCPSRKVYGITYGVKDGILGGWSEYIYLKPNVKIIKLPETIRPEAFIGAGCGLPTAFHAIEQASIRLGDTVVVQGSGPVGLNAVILAQLAGALKVIVVGGPAHRLAVAAEFGADAVIDIETMSREERIDKVRELTNGRGADVVIEATGVPGAVPEGMAMARDAGMYVIVGQYTDNGETAVNPHQAINKKHLAIKGTWGIDLSHFYRSVQVMAKYSRRFAWEKMISRHYGLHEINQAIADVEKQTVMKAVIKPKL